MKYNINVRLFWWYILTLFSLPKPPFFPIIYSLIASALPQSKLTLSLTVLSFPPVPPHCANFDFTACCSTVEKGVALSSTTMENFYHYTCHRSPEEFNPSISPTSDDPKTPIGYIYIFMKL
jgi:hypothetical protein